MTKLLYFYSEFINHLNASSIFTLSCNDVYLVRTVSRLFAGSMRYCYAFSAIITFLHYTLIVVSILCYYYTLIVVPVLIMSNLCLFSLHYVCACFRQIFISKLCIPSYLFFSMYLSNLFL